MVFGYNFILNQREEWMKIDRIKQLPGWSCIARYSVSILVVLFLTVFLIQNAYAIRWENGQNLKVDLDTTISYSAAMRVEEQDTNALAVVDNDDGNRNFKQGDMINNMFKIVMEADVRYKNNFGVFARGRSFYDFAYMGSNSNDSPGTLNTSSGNNQDFSEETEDRHGRDTELLDFYAYGSWQAGENNIDLRVGRQAVSWGESLFLFNSLMTAQSPLDATAANVPGAELKELVLPVGQVYASVDVSNLFTFAAYYQWEYEPTRLNESGAYFGVDGLQGNDIMLYSGEQFLAFGGIPNTGVKEADDSGQYGLALRFVAESLNYTEFGLYFINYHEKLPNPVIAWAGPPSSYSFTYAEDIKVYGFSMGTAVGDTNVGVEMTYRQDFPINVAGPTPLGVYAKGDVFQGQMSAIALLPNILTADKVTLMGEIGFNTVFNYEGAINPGKDKISYGFVAKVTPSWDGIAPGLDLSVPLTAKVNPYGVSPVGATFTENANSYGIGLDFIYKQIYNFGVFYTMFTGDWDDNSNTDRDFIGFNCKYTF